MADADERSQIIEQVWWQVLGGPENPSEEREGFVSLGGYSLAAARFTGMVKDRLGIELPLDLLLSENASLTEICAHAAVLEPTVDPATPATPPAESSAAARRTESAMAPGQRRLWLLSKLHPGSSAYNVVMALRLNGPLSIEALKAALSDVVARHDVLRARVVEEPGGEPWLHYAAEVKPELVVREAERPLDDELVAEFVRAAGAKAIGMDTAPLLRAELLRGGDHGSPEACLVIAVHHIVSDQRSADIIAADLARAYDSRLAGQPPVFRPAPSFGDYADVEAAARGDARWAEDLAYWRRTLGCSPGNGELPFPIRSPAVPSFRGSDHDLRFTPEETRGIDSYTRANGITPAMVLLGCVSVVISAWLGSERVIIGMPASRRRTSGEQDLVGFLVETLPIVADMAGNASLNSLIRRLRDRYVAALDHSAPTFDAIVDALELPARPLASPLFQVWFNDLTQGSPAPAMQGLEVAALPTSGTAALFDLNFYLHRDQHGYRLQLVRSVDRVRKVVAEELLDQCRVVLTQILSEDAAPLAGLSLVTPRAAAAWRPAATGRAPDKPAPLAGTAPQRSALALVTPFGELTHGEFDRLVEEQAEKLACAGVTPGTMVEIHARRAGGLPLALLACQRLGAVAGLVDAELPAAWRTRARRLLRPAQILSVHADATAKLSREAVDASPRALPAAGHVLFTSGSTGEQLAVVARHESIESALAWYSHAFAPGPEDRVALLAGLGHDPVLRDMLVPLRFGGTLVIPSSDVYRNPRALFDLLSSHRITILHTTPALLELILAAHAAEPHVRLDALRLVISAGAPLTAGQVRRLRSLTAAAIVNGYGTTETPQLASCHSIIGYGESPADLADHPDDAVMSIGHGAAGNRLLVHTSRGRPAGIGQVGEILVRGDQLAVGYLDGGESDDRFIPDPWGMPGVRVFRTGDLARLGPDGEIYWCGRMDDQLNVDGFRVEPAEIETAARRHPGVVQAAAGMTGTATDPVLTLHVVPGPGIDLSAADVRTHLRTQMTSHAIPGKIRVVSSLATSVNHKIVLDETAVPPATRSGAGADPGRVRGTAGDPRGELLPWLAGLFQDVAGTGIAPDQNFFEAGLTSMTLLRVHARIAAALPDAPPATTLFAYPTLEALARFLSGQSGSPRPTRRRTNNGGGQRLRSRDSGRESG